jgi:hypothetical protein
MTIYKDSLVALLQELMNDASVIRASLVYRLSDISDADLEQLKVMWSDLPVEQRQKLLSRLVQTSESNFETDFSKFGLFALQDDDSLVRTYAIGTLWTNDGRDVMLRLIDVLLADNDMDVKSAAAVALGKYVQMAEEGNLSNLDHANLKRVLLEVLETTPSGTPLYRRALESAAYLNAEEIMVIIDATRSSTDVALQATGIFAMGRSADLHWKKHVLTALVSSEPELRYEAARAAGELGLTDAVSKLETLVREDDSDIQEAAIWALGEIGGSKALGILNNLLELHVSNGVKSAVREALDSASMGVGDIGGWSQLQDEAPKDDLDNHAAADSDLNGDLEVR